MFNINRYSFNIIRYIKICDIVYGCFTILSPVGLLTGWPIAVMSSTAKSLQAYLMKYNLPTCIIQVAYTNN